MKETDVEVLEPPQARQRFANLSAGENRGRETRWGSWAVIRYVPSLPTDKVEGEFPAFFDGWFGRQEEALAVAQNWVSQHPEHAVVVIRANRFLGKGSNVQ